MFEWSDTQPLRMLWDLPLPAPPPSPRPPVPPVRAVAPPDPGAGPHWPQSAAECHPEGWLVSVSDRSRRRTRFGVVAAGSVRDPRTQLRWTPVLLDDQPAAVILVADGDITTAMPPPPGRHRSAAR